MITITVNNSFSQIKGLSREEMGKLRKALSYLSDPNAAYHSGGFQRRKYLIDINGNFPTGLLDRVKETIPHYTLQDDRRKPQRIRPGQIWPKGITPYQEQDHAVRAAGRNVRGGVVMPTASGKSIVISAVAALHGLKTLVVVPTVELKTQLSKTLAHLPKVRVENIDSSQLDTLTDFDCLIIDEAHHSAAKTYQKLNRTAWKGIYYRYFFTATYFRNQEHEQLLFEGICGRPIYELTIKDAMDKGIISKLDAFYIDLPKQQHDAYTWGQVYSELVVNNEYRNNVIAGLLQSLEAIGAPTICLVKEIKHGAILSGLTGIPFANGQDEESRAFIQEFNSGKIKALIGTNGILGEGVDTKPAEYVIVAGLGKAKSAFMQSIGRVLRRHKDKESGKVIILRDRSQKYLLRHFSAQVKILKEEYGITPIKLGVV